MDEDEEDGAPPASRPARRSWRAGLRSCSMRPRRRSDNEEEGEEEEGEEEEDDDEGEEEEGGEEEGEEEFDDELDMAEGRR